MTKYTDDMPVTISTKVKLIRSKWLTRHQRFQSQLELVTALSSAYLSNEQQRQRPATCWQLWKEGRGTNEAHQRGGKLQAVEYVEANQPGESDDKRTQVDFDAASFDGFSVIWTPGINGSTECNLAVRFNFLSTDFSHFKGVKGIPVRLCAKTETPPTGSYTLWQTFPRY